VNAPLLAQYGSQIRFEFRHFPLRGIHPYALDAAEAAECAADQGKFWEFVDMDYTNQSQLSNKSLKEWAERLGLDMDLFDRCTRSNIKRDTIMADYKAGEDAGVTGTPTYFVAGKKTEATVEALGAAIQAAAAGTSTRL
jgi:protein-disulfide isomerase